MLVDFTIYRFSLIDTCEFLSIYDTYVCVYDMIIIQYGSFILLLDERRICHPEISRGDQNMRRFNHKTNSKTQVCDSL